MKLCGLFFFSENSESKFPVLSLCIVTTPLLARLRTILFTTIELSTLTLSITELENLFYMILTMVEMVYVKSENNPSGIFTKSVSVTCSVFYTLKLLCSLCLWQIS